MKCALAERCRRGDTASVNFLAHLVLAPQTPEGLIGSIAPDMIRGPLPADLHPAVAESAREHQRIDRFTDRHRAFSRTRSRLSAHVDSRLTGILADVLYDHVLASGWSDWQGDLLDEFVLGVEGCLLDRLGLVPSEMRLVVRRMIEQRWLASYASSAGIRERLSNLSGRLTSRLGRPMDLTLTGPQLAGVMPGVADDFGVLWPDLLAYVAGQRAGVCDRLAS